MIYNAVFLLYAVFLFVGGYFGFKKGSRVSLISGVSSGLLILAAILINLKDPDIGQVLVSFITGFLSLIFLHRYSKTKTFMPSGLLLVVSLFFFAIAAIALTLYQI